MFIIYSKTDENETKDSILFSLCIIIIIIFMSV